MSAGHGRADVMDMTLAQVDGFLGAIAREQGRAMQRAALAARVAPANEKQWSKIMKAWNGEA